jgi:hypothetical protein
MTKSKRFTAEVEQGHKGCAVILPFDPDRTWGRKERHFVTGTLAGHAVDGEVGHRWGRFFVCVDDDLREALRLAPGDAVTVSLRPRAKDELDGGKAPRLPGFRIRGTLRARSRPGTPPRGGRARSPRRSTP